MPDLPLLIIKEARWMQLVIESLLYYGRILNCTILPALDKSGTQQAMLTENTRIAVKLVLDYVSTYNTTYLPFTVSDMNLDIDSDAAYLLLLGAKSCTVGCFQLLSKNPTTTTNNGKILIEYPALKYVVTSAVEVETWVVFHGTNITIPIQYILMSIGHPLVLITILTDNSTAD